MIEQKKLNMTPRKIANIIITKVTIKEIITTLKKPKEFKNEQI